MKGWYNKDRDVDMQRTNRCDLENNVNKAVRKKYSRTIITIVQTEI